MKRRGSLLRKFRNVFGGTAPAWVPTDLAGCVLWLRADGIVGLSDGDPVGTWSDLSGNGYNFSQATESQKPVYKINQVNSLPCVRFDASDDLLANATIPTTGTSHTIFFVVKPTTAGPAYNRLFNITGKGEVYWYTSNTWAFAYITEVTRALTLNSWTYLTTKAANTAATLYTKGVGTSGVITGFSVAQPVNLGNISTGIRGFGGDVAEVIIYSSALSDGDRGTVESYLATKYGL